MTTSNYICKQLERFHSHPEDSIKHDALWRIASNADIFTPDYLNQVTESGGIFPPQDMQTIKSWLHQNGYL
jgi:hypothetical protein